ncbi:hypothetical protein HU200_061483 [Digitaria exilis]|uniref:F-box domain-containing protein n=1 Tax=Digitaria exilis TaxID=1010633 RepID=A0A835A8F8_9POAL|nr:hypothetical protein HU200_061483 [Digitaria exilis]
MYEILLRLPAKLLCRLRAVCRPWRALLSDPQFAAAHSARNPDPLIVAGYAENEGNGMIVDIMDMSGQIVKRVRQVEGSDRVMSMELDLVFVKNVDSGSYKFLFPATGGECGFGVNQITEPKFILGQVPSTGEYKVLKLMYHFSLRLTCQLLEVCTLNSSSHSGWRKKEIPGDDVSFCNLTRLVIDGIVYFLCSDTHHSVTFKDQVIEEDLIITFDLKTEAWGPRIRRPPISFSNNTVQMFDNIGRPIIKQLTLAHLNGSLVVVHGPAPYMDFWILTDFDKGFWVKQYSIQFEQYGHLMPVHPLLVLGDGRVVIHKEDNGFLQIYDQVPTLLLIQ